MINLLHSWLQPPQQLDTHFVSAGHEALQHGSTKHGTRFLQGPKTKLDSKYYLLQNGTDLIVNSDQIKNQSLDLKKIEIIVPRLYKAGTESYSVTKEAAKINTKMRSAAAIFLTISSKQAGYLLQYFCVIHLCTVCLHQWQQVFIPILVMLS